VPIQPRPFSVTLSSLQTNHNSVILSERGPRRSSAQDSQAIVQSTKVEGDTETSIDCFSVHKTTSFSYPFNLSYDYQVNSDGSSYQTTKSNQGDVVDVNDGISFGPWHPGISSQLSNNVIAQDTLNFDASGNFTGNTGAKSSQSYQSNDSLSGCYSEKLESASGVLTSATKGAPCQPW